MGVWTDRLLPRLIDRELSAPDIEALRDAGCEGLTGRVLEIGFGSGLNIGHYGAEVTRVDAVEPSDVAWSISAKRRGTSSIPIRRVGLDGQRLTASDETYDAALSTFTLCTIPDVDLALTEVRRVLRPGSAFHFVEHGLAPADGIQRWQRRFEPLQRRFCGGCHLTRDMPALMKRAGLDVVAVQADYLPGPKVARPWNYGFLGRAIRPLVGVRP
jgi:SAM-dependent methyltransferase